MHPFRFVAALLLALASLASADEKPYLTLASTTSTNDSGLFSAILPKFEADTGVQVRVVAVGTGQALEIGRRGDAEALLVHDRASEDRFLTEGNAIVVDDGLHDATGRLADELAAAHPGIVRAVHHPTNLGYGAALRSGFAASRLALVAFTDGDRQFRVADLGPLLTRLASDDRPDVVVGYRIKRADPPIRTLYARRYRLANRIFFGLRVRDIDCACMLFRREALQGISVESGGAFFSAELLVKLDASGRRIADRGAPLPAPGGLAHRGEAVGDLARGEGLLVNAAADVGQSVQGAPARTADPRLGAGRPEVSCRDRRPRLPCRRRAS